LQVKRESSGGKIEHPNANSEGFDLAALVDLLKLESREEIYINWDDLTTIDPMRFKDLTEHFDSVWYPGPDDTEIFDASLSWILSVDHEGYLGVMVLDGR
jgi:hypothetical protein